MKTSVWLRWLAVAALVAAVVLTGPMPALAATSVTLGEASVRAGDIHHGDLTVTIGELTVDGDVTGEVRNNLGSIVIRGTVGRNAVTDVGEIRVENGGKVAGEVRSSAGEIVIRGEVGGRVKTSAGEIVVRGRVGEDIELDAGEVTISGEVGGDVRLRRGVVRLQSGAVVHGGVFVEEGWVERSTGVSVTTVDVRRERRDFSDGLSVGFFQLPQFDRIQVFDNGFGPWSMYGQWFTPLAYGGLWRLGRAVVIFLVGMAVLALFPDRLRRMADRASDQPGPSLGFGLLGFVAMPLIIVLLIISILGIVAVPFVIVAMALVWLLAHIVVALTLGRAIAARLTGPDQAPWHEFGQLGIGLLILAAIGFVPLVGWLATAVAMLVGLGAVITSRFGRPANGGHPPAA